MLKIVNSYNKYFIGIELTTGRSLVPHCTLWQPHTDISMSGFAEAVNKNDLTLYECCSRLCAFKVRANTSDADALQHSVRFKYCAPC